MASLPNFNALLMEGYNTGREMKRQEGERNALAGLFGARIGKQSPGIGDGRGDYDREEEALGELARYNPQLAYQIQGQRSQQQAEMEKKRQAMLEQGKKAVGQAALQIAQLPEAQRAQAWDQQIDYLVRQGWDGLAQFRGQYSPQNLMGVISEAGLANELRTATQPRIITPQQGSGAFAMDGQGNITTIIAPNPGDKPMGAQVDVPMGSPLQGAPNSKVIGGKQYWNIGGKWYDNPEGR